MNLLVLQVWEHLKKKDPLLATRYLEAFPESQKNTEDLSIAMREQNRFWRVELGTLPTDTIPCRRALQDGLPIDEGIDAFTQDVLPVIVSDWTSPSSERV